MGSNPVEYLLVALSGCLTTSMIAHASAKGIDIRGVESRYEGDIDLRGFLGISEDVPVGYQNIRVYFKIDANLSENEKEDLVRMAKNTRRFSIRLRNRHWFPFIWINKKRNLRYILPPD